MKLLGDCEKENLCSTDQPWSQTVKNILHQFKQCKTPIDDRSPCNYFVSRALEIIYKITVFKNEGDSSKPYFTSNEIALFVERNPGVWECLGLALDQNVLDNAQRHANLSKAVIAVLKGSPNGHVAIIIPGNIKTSGNWNLDVPCAASFFLDKPSKSFVGCPLSYAFESPSNVTIYSRRF